MFAADPSPVEILQKGDNRTDIKAPWNSRPITVLSRLLAESDSEAILMAQEKIKNLETFIKYLMQVSEKENN